MNAEQSAEKDAITLLRQTAMDSGAEDMIEAALGQAWDEGSHATAYSGVTYTANPYRVIPPASGVTS